MITGLRADAAARLHCPFQYQVTEITVYVTAPMLWHSSQRRLLKALQEHCLDCDSVESTLLTASGRGLYINVFNRVQRPTSPVSIPVFLEWLDAECESLWRRELDGAL